MDSRSERLICEGANIYEGEFGRRVMSREGKQTSESILILCVDRDDDIGRKTGVKTPIIGKEDNMKSALKLILADPEEADANAMFEAIRLYNVLNKNKKSEEKYEIATISGSEIGGVTADRKLVAELGEVLKKFPADGLILVTDGFSDEDIMPLIKTRIPVTSVRRVVIKHSESIEETAALFSRYWRMIIEDPKYSRIALGLPGILLISLGILILLKTFIKFDIYTWIAIVGLIILGSYLLGKGYRIDRKISSITPRLYHYSISGMVESFSLTFGFILIGIGFYQAGSFIVSKYGLGFHFPMDAEKLIALLPLIIGWFINKIITLAIVGICTIFLGKSIAYLLERDARFWRMIALIVVSAWSWTILNEISRIILDPSLPPDGLVMSVIIGIAVIAVSGSATLLLSRKYRDLFKGKKKRKAEDAEAEGSS